MAWMCHEAGTSAILCKADWTGRAIGGISQRRRAFIPAGPATDLILTDDGTVHRCATKRACAMALSQAWISASAGKFDLRRGSLLAFVEISNVLDRNNECCLDWDIIDGPAGDEVLERGLDYWMPMLPAIGILWEF